MQIGQVWTDGYRVYVVLSFDSWFVRFVDCYPDGFRAVRRGSRIAWDLATEAGEHWTMEGDA